MVGRANNGLFTPACKKFYARFWMIEAFAGVAVRTMTSAARHAGVIIQAVPGVTYPG